MAEQAKAPVRVQVTGDILTETRIYQGRRLAPLSQMKVGTRIVTGHGNADFLHDLLESLFLLGDTPRPKLEFGLDRAIIPIPPAHLTSYELWKPFPATSGSKTLVWRMEKALGYGDRGPDGPSTKERIYALARAREDAEESPGIAVIDDAGLLFRNHDLKTAWPAWLASGNRRPPRWILLKTLMPLAGNELLRAATIHAERLVLVVDAEDIRRAEIRVTRSISWERCALDLVRELRTNPVLKPLLACRHLFVRFGLEGVLHVEMAENQVLRSRLFFDPERLEGDFDAALEGTLFGAGSCLAASLVHMLSQAMEPGGALEKHPDFSSDLLKSAISGGLASARRLLLDGHGVAEEGEGPAIPFAALAASMRKPGLSLGSAWVPCGQKAYLDEVWTILGANHDDLEGRNVPLHGVAVRVAILGPSVLLDVPKLSFRNLLTVDRAEIESLRTLKSLLETYACSREASPMSIGVFGPPGSGKSFSVRQIATGVFGDGVPFLEFNLSQFNGPDDLIGAFHQVRDRALSGRVPVVFWDEFDCREYHWLQYFLGPMQDGTFQEGQITHPIGRCIFVFAGGVCESFRTFGPKSAEDQAFKERKGPDFRSRLSAFLDVVGLNPVDDHDVYFPIRRALLLRSLLGCRDGELLDMDRGLLTALLLVKRYEHGSRSLGKIAGMLRNRGIQGGLRRSDLPAKEVVSLHANMEDIESLAARDNAFRSQADFLAPFIHGFYRELCRRNNWPIKYDMDFADLSEHMKVDNLDAAERVPVICRLVGLRIVAQGTAGILQPAEARAILKRKLEMLAEAEHDGWMESRIRNGWTYGEVRNDDQRIHDLIRPYRDLPDRQKEKDRDAVLHYPEIVSLAGFGLAREI